MTSIECVLHSGAVLGESPWWDKDDQRLWWVDIRKRLLHCFDPAECLDISYDVGEQLGCAVRQKSGGLLLAMESGIYSFNPSESTKILKASLDINYQGQRFNDGCTDPVGRFWVGSMIDDGGPAKQMGRIYRLDMDGKLSAFFKPVFTANGIAFAPDGKYMYFADTNRAVQTIWVCEYDLETGIPSKPKTFLGCDDLAGRPDGATVDVDGCYWFAAVGGWSIVRVTPKGKIDRTIKLPIEKPSKVMFGGASLDTLFVTSISEKISNRPAQPDAGSLFAIYGLGTTGIAQNRYSD